MSKKIKLINAKGGKCKLCGYNKNYAALNFHHRNPREKLFGLDTRKCSNSSWASLMKEAEKCDILCFNCHMEHHYPHCSIEVLYPKYQHKISLPVIKVCNCGKIIEYRANMCNKCFKLSIRKAERPSKEKLLELIKTLPFTKIAIIYGVTDNAIRKWCKFYGLPYKKKEISPIGLEPISAD